MKTCPKCKKNDTEVTFANKGTYCRQCTKEYGQKYMSLDSSLRGLGNRLLRQYGITLEEYNILLQKQNGVCAICEKKCRTKKRLAVDHDHQTGKVRGLVCEYCNLWIYRCEKNKKLIDRIEEYLTSGISNSSLVTQEAS